MASKKNDKGCNEYAGMSRRNFLGISGTTAAALGLPAWFPKMAFSQTGPCPPCTLIKFFARGGWDGLTICPPYADPYYQNTLRPVPNPGVNNDTLGYAAPSAGSVFSCLDLDGYFGLPTAFSNLYNNAWNVTTPQLAFAHATGYTNNHSYSHFVGQYQLEVGKPNPTASLVEGWLGRHLQTRMTASGCTDPLIRGLAYGVAKQRSIVGGTDCIAAPDPTNYSLDGSSATMNFRLDALRDMYVAEGMFDDIAEQTIDTILQLSTVNFAGYSSAGSMPYPSHPLGQTFKTIAAIMIAGQTNPNLGVEVFGVDYGSWDHHSAQDPHDQFTASGEGKMHRTMREVDEAFTAFYLDMQARMVNDYLIYAMSEFGRTNKENGGAGTDHAKGGAMMFLGPRVNGGQVYRQGWAPGNLNNMVSGNDNNDLNITTDVRDIATELIDKCLDNVANVNNNTIFPADPLWTPPTPANYPGLFN